MRNYGIFIDRMNHDGSRVDYVHEMVEPVKGVR
jgi:hypothetical protein